jgi:hypothetical protein
MKPWVGVFNEAFATSLIDLDKVSVDVFLAILECADKYGRAYPGVKRLAERSRHRRERVTGSIRKLHEVGLLRSLWSPGENGAAHLEFYMVSPSVFAALPELRSATARIWAELCTSLPENIGVPSPRSNDHPLMRDVQEWGGVNARSSDHQQPQQPDQPKQPDQPEPPPASDSESGGSATGLGKEGREEKSERRRRRQSAAAQAANPTAAKTPDQTPHTPQPPSPLRVVGGRAAARLTPRELPLEFELEAVAEQLYRGTRYELSLANARALVVEYGAAKCAAAVGHMQNQKQVLNRAGYLRWVLQNGQVDPDRDGKRSEQAIAANGGQGIAGGLEQFVIE